jgi:DNA-binding transcriptional MerR regulator
MKEPDETLYQPNEFAELAKVTVRTLHHYHRLGLLKPSGYTKAGHRLYRKRDLVRLQQIVTLKFIGFSLQQIKELLDAKSFNLAIALRQQREILAEKQRGLERAIKAIEQAERAIETSNEPEAETFRKIIEVINMQNNMEWTSKYYSEDARQKIEERARTTPREVIEQGQRDWAILIQEVEAAVSERIEPSSERAQSLARRWSELLHAFTGDDAQIQAGLNKMYADQSNWPATFPKPFSDEAGAFMCEAIAVSKNS